MSRDTPASTNESRPAGPAAPVSLIAPTPEQLAWQQAGLGVFFHVGVNTFGGVEWSDGAIPAADFAPSELDADQWVRTAKDLGAAYVVLTAKHHDGFCLWPTATTDYSVASSPFRDGQGDVVREVADACRRHGVGLGLYLSPWDRNAPQYEDPEAYDEFYLAQLRELCTNYGELVELWFDGAGSAGREYAWDRIGALIDELQPGAMVFNMGPATIRWVGNEDGLAADPCWYVTSSADLNNYDEDTVSFGQERYLPPECDVSIRTGWFWHAAQEPKSLEHLLAIHDRSIGLGANLLLNLPPDRRGLIDQKDVERCRELRDALDARFGDPQQVSLRARSEDGSFWEATAETPLMVQHLELREDITTGQRVHTHLVLDESGAVMAQGGTIGVRRLHRLETPVEVSRLRIECTGEQPRLSALHLHAPSEAPVPRLPLDFEASRERPDA